MENRQDAGSSACALPSGANVQDAHAEMAAVFVYLRDVWHQVGAGGIPPRVLVLIDCHSVLVDIEWARRAGSLRALCANATEDSSWSGHSGPLQWSPHTTSCLSVGKRASRHPAISLRGRHCDLTHLDDTPVDLHTLIGQSPTRRLTRQSSSSASVRAL